MEPEVIPFVATCFLLVHSRAVPKSPNSPYKCSQEYDDRCLNDVLYRCFFRKGIYRPVSLRRCSGRLNTCRCYTSPGVSFCRCVDPRPTPNFPSTGVIRWNGTQRIETYHGVSTFQLFGEVRRDSDGNIVRKWMGDQAMHQFFDVTIPSKDGNGFVMYVGSSVSTQCRSCKVSQPRNLTSIWSRSSAYSIMIETQREEKVEQKWLTIDQAERLRPRDTAEDTFYLPTWYVKISTDDAKTVPTMFEYDISDGFAEYYETVHINFTYQDMAEEKFRLEELCNEGNIVEEKDCGKLMSRNPSYFQGSLN